MVAAISLRMAPHPGPLPASGEREGPAQREGEGHARWFHALRGRRRRWENCPKIRVCSHQRAQPAVFELLHPPCLRDVVAITGKCRRDCFCDGLRVVERAIGIEHECLDHDRVLFWVPRTKAQTLRVQSMRRPVCALSGHAWVRDRTAGFAKLTYKARLILVLGLS